jgi:hypothetical protein
VLNALCGYGQSLCIGIENNSDAQSKEDGADEGGNDDAYTIA